MKRLLLLPLILLVAAAPAAFAQAGTTFVTATVKDSNGTAYVNCQWSVVFVGQNTTPGAGPYAPAAYTNGQQGTCDSFGFFSVNLGDNINTITPKPSQWSFSICSTTNYQPGNQYCKANILITITGVAQDISTTLTLALPILPQNGGGGCIGCTPGVIPQATTPLSIANTSPQLDNGLTLPATLTYAGSGGINLPTDGVHAGSFQLGGNTALPTLYNNSVGFLGPASASFSSYFFQFPNAPPSSGQTFVFGTPTGSPTVIPITYGAGGGGSCSNCVNTAPSGAQAIVQNLSSNATTPFSANNLSNIRYVTASYNWSVTPGGSYTGGVGATLTFTNCPAGVSASDTNLYVYITGGTGTVEAVVVGGGTCTPGLASGTLTFTPANSHSGAFSVMSASTGIYEALKDATQANANNAHLILQPSNPPGSGYVYSVYAPITVKGAYTEIDGGGAAVMDCEAPRACFLLPVNANFAHIHGIRTGTKSTLAATSTNAAITQTACATNVSTITTTLAPVVGSVVDIQGTFSQHYWGPHVVASSSGSAWTYTDTNCGGATTIGSQSTAGGNAYQFAFIEDNGQQTHIDHIAIDAPSGFQTNAFNNFAVVLNDQAFHGSDLSLSGLGGCNTNYCAQAIYAPGPFSTNSAVLYIDHAGITPGCTGNGITNWAGNTLSINDSVIQGTNQWSVWGGTLKGGFGPSTITNMYNEVGNCTNPDYPGSGAAQQGNAGLIQTGTYATVRGGEGPIGNLPIFAKTGNQNTQYNYYLVIHDSSLGVSLPLFCGYALVDSVTPTGSITVACPRVQGTNTITYDVIRSSGAGINRVFPSTAVCGGGSTTACGSILTAQAQCSTEVCSFSDTASASTTSYTVNPAAYFPLLNFWPGGVVIAVTGDTTNTSTATTPALVAEDTGNFVTNASPIIVEQIQAPSVRSNNCSLGNPGAWMSCVGGSSVGNTNPGVIGTLLQNGAGSGGTGNTYKGRLNFMEPPASSGLVNSDVITYFDSNPSKTIGSAIFRPTPDANDCAAGIDVINTQSSVGLATRCSSSISRYIGALPDGMSYKERLTSTADTYNVPIGIVPVAFSTLPSCASGTAGYSATITDNTYNYPGAVVTGGGSLKASIYCDGSNWLVGTSALPGSLSTSPMLPLISGVFSTSATSLTTITGLTSPSIPAGKKVSFQCTGLYSIATGAAKVSFGVTATQTPQSIWYGADIAYDVIAGASAKINATASGTALQSVSNTVATATTYNWYLSGFMLWNASTAGTFSIQAATSSGTDALTVTTGATCQYQIVN